MKLKAQKVPKKSVDPQELIATFCFYFPHYSFNDARKLPYKRITLMLKVARKEQARIMYQLTQMIAAPHSKKGSGVKKMLEYFKSLIDN